MRKSSGLMLLAALLLGPVILRPNRPALPATVKSTKPPRRCACIHRSGLVPIGRCAHAKSARGPWTCLTMAAPRPPIANRSPSIPTTRTPWWDAWVLSGRHEFEQSVEWANKALKVDANRADAYGLLGDAASEMGDYDAAFEHYQKMLDLKPDIASYSRSAHLLFITGGFKKATLLMSKANRRRRGVPGK